MKRYPAAVSYVPYSMNGPSERTGKRRLSSIYSYVQMFQHTEVPCHR